MECVNLGLYSLGYPILMSRFETSGDFVSDFLSNGTLELLPLESTTSEPALGIVMMRLFQWLPHDMILDFEPCCVDLFEVRNPARQGVDGRLSSVNFSVK